MTLVLRLFDSWQFAFLPVFLAVFWLLFVFKNLSAFRKEFQKTNRKERSSERGTLLIKEVQRKYIGRSVIALIVCVGFYMLVCYAP
jgi:predicted secreted protein